MNQPELTIKKNHVNEHFFYEINRNTFDQKSSKDVFDSYFKDGLLKKETLYIFSGSDSGLLIDYLLGQTLPKDSLFVFVELDYIEAYIDKELLMNHQQIHITNQDNWREYLKEININSYVYKSALMHVKSLAAVSLYDINYHTLNLALSEEIQTILFTTSANLSHSSIFIKEQINNVTENQTPAGYLLDKFKGLPCIILAAGPSLGQHIEWVKQHREKFVVLAVSRISARLIKENITPDILFTVDAYDISFTVSREMFLFKEPPILIHSYHASSLIVSQWHGQQLYLKNLLPWESPLNKENVKAPGPTVTNTALYTAIEMGFSDIYLLGVDLCFSQTGESHESSSIESKAKGTNLAKINETVETYEGKQAETTIPYKLAAQSLDQLAKYAKTKEVNVYNLSSSALHLENINFKPQETVIIPSESITERKSILTKVATTTNNIEHLTALKKEFTTIIKSLKEVKKLAESALDHNAKLFKDKGKEGANFSHKIKMDKIEKKLNKKYTITNDFLKATGVSFFTQCINIQKSNDWNDELIKDTGDLYYQAYIKSYNDIIPQLEAANKRILSRLDEWSKAPNLHAIIQQWKDDRHFTRLKAIEYKNIKLFNLIQEVLPNEFNELMALSEKQLTETSEHEKSLLSTSKIHNIKQKIILRFRQKDKNNLAQMLVNLTSLAEENNNENKEDIDVASNTVKAYLAFLDNEFNQTLQAYNTIKEDKLGEDDYIIMAQCAVKIQDSTLAESIFHKLSIINFNHLPKLAQIQKINGRNQQAIESYSHYLEQKPHDIYQWLSLSKLLISLKQNEAALETIQCVLRQDPNNETAKSYLKQMTT